MTKTEEIIFRRLSLKHGLSEQIIKEICHSQFEFTNKKIKELDLKKLSDDEIKKSKTNFRFRRLGSLYISDKLLYVRKKLNEKKNGNNG